MKKNCLNCMRVKPLLDGMIKKGHGCIKNPEMRVNGRMVCEEWKSGDILTVNG